MKADSRYYSDKLERLREKIAEKEGILVAFSGGVDSGLLAKVAYDVLGENAFAVILDADTLPRSELRDAEKFAEEIGIKHSIVKISELDNEDFTGNPPDRCYHCKKVSAKVLKEIASQKGIEIIAYGVNLSDFDEHRPGIKASDEEGIWHPFVDVAITKEDIRSISRELGLFLWDKSSSACLASRIPYGEEITKEKLKMIEQAEEALKERGLTQVRVRMHGRVARIEVLEDEFEMLLNAKKEIANELKRMGFEYITLDFEGYRSGSMDEVL